MSTFIQRILTMVLVGGCILAQSSTVIAATKGLNVDLKKALIFIDQAEHVATAAHAHVAIAIVDQGGNLVAFQKMDDTQLGSIDLAIKKAKTALSFSRPTVDMEHALNKGNFMIATLPNALPAGGGYPVIVDGKIIGALGLSGGEGETDAQLAQKAVDNVVSSGRLLMAQ